MGLLSGFFNPDMWRLQFNIVGIQVIVSQVTHSQKCGEKFKLMKSRLIASRALKSVVWYWPANSC